MKITLVVKRNDGKIKERFSECTNLKVYCSGIDLMLGKGLAKGYLIKDTNTGDVLVQKGNF